MSEVNRELSNILDALDGLNSILNRFRDYQNGYFPVRPPEFFALELAGEAGEVANNEKKLWKGRDVAQEQLADEAADVLIALVNYCNAREINLADSVKAKLNSIEELRLERKQQGLTY